MAATIRELSTAYGLPESHVGILDFQRSPTWRLEVADMLRRQLEENPHGRIKHSDPLVKRLGDFLFRWYNVIGETEHEQHCNRLRYLSTAYADMLWSFPVANASEDHPARLEIEARLLAGQDTSEIAKLVQVPQRMIDVYQSCFYEVTHRLPNRAYIMSHCLKNEATTIEQQTKHFVVRLFAYFGGIHVMEPFLYNYPVSIAVPSSPTQLRDYFKEVFRHTLARRGIFMATFFAPTKFNVSDLVATVRQMHQVEEEAMMGGGMGGGNINQSAEVVHALVDAVRWSHGLDGKRQAIDTYGTIIESPRQISLEDKVKLNLGESLENEAEIRDWKFPVPEKRIEAPDVKMVKGNQED